MSVPDEFKDLYAFYGRAAHVAQNLEKELITLIMHHNLLRLGRPITIEDYTKEEKEFEKVTLGSLKEKLKSIADFSDEQKTYLNDGNNKRIRLIHHFFDDHLITMGSREGREKMIREIEDIRLHLQSIFKAASDYNLRSFIGMGIDPDKI